jgi:TolB-like protein
VAACLALPPVRGDVPAGERSVVIAALPFDERSADNRYAALAAGMGDILMAGLSEAEGLRFVEREALEAVLRELAAASVAAPASRARLGKAVGAQFVLTGSVAASGDDIRITAELLEVSTARVAGAVKVAARADRLAAAVAKLTRELVGRLNVELPELTPEQIDRSPEANLHFVRGLGYYYAGMPEHATAQFLKTLAIDPAHAEARFYNGMAYFDHAGEHDHAAAEFGRFLKDFGKHRLARRAAEKLRQCEDRPGRSGEGAPQ